MEGKMKLIDKDKLLDDIHSHYEANNPEQNRIMDECAMIVIKSRTVDTSDVCVAVLQAMMDKLKRILWWMAWLLLPTATLVARVERETGKSLGSNWLYIATVVAFAGYMVLDVVNGLK